MNVSRQPRIGILLSDPAQRYALKTAVCEFGYEIGHCSDAAPDPVNGSGEDGDNDIVDIWFRSKLIQRVCFDDSRVGSREQTLIEVEEYIPSVITAEYVVWKEDFKGRFAQIVLNHRRAVGDIPATQVWLLAASTGGLHAVGRFLAQVPPASGIGFVYAQHIQVEQAFQLVKMVKRNSQWRAGMACAGGFAPEGYVTVVSPGERVSIDSNNVLNITGEKWSGQYQPSVDQVAVDLAACYRQHAGMIVFTGMGDDGVAGSKAIKAAGGSVWVQSPSSCTATAMPEAILSRGESDVSADIDTLADMFNTRLSAAPQGRFL